MSTASALATFSPPNRDISYSVGVPMSTTNAGSGDIYIQIKAPTSYQWVAIGIGQGMTGATIFVIYADGTGNVTVSPRTGVGHVMPLFNSAAQTTVLAGSGISNGVMTANFKYVAASGLLSLSSTSSGWIGSWKSGDPLNTNDQSAIINQHDDHSVYTLDLSKAQLADDSNPFVTSTSASSASATASGSGSSQTSVSSSGSSGSDSSGSAVTYVDPITTFEMAHGSIMSAAMVVLFPLGAIVMRLGGGVWLHAAIQLFTLAAIITGFGLGIHLAMISGFVSYIYLATSTTKIHKLIEAKAFQLHTHHFWHGHCLPLPCSAPSRSFAPSSVSEAWPTLIFWTGAHLVWKDIDHLWSHQWWLGFATRQQHNQRQGRIRCCGRCDVRPVCAGNTGYRFEGKEHMEARGFKSLKAFRGGLGDIWSRDMHTFWYGLGNRTMNFNGL